MRKSAESGIEHRLDRLYKSVHKYLFSDHLVHMPHLYPIINRTLITQIISISFKYIFSVHLLNQCHLRPINSAQIIINQHNLRPILSCVSSAICVLLTKYIFI